MPPPTPTSRCPQSGRGHPRSGASMTIRFDLSSPRPAPRRHHHLPPRGSSSGRCWRRTPQRPTYPGQEAAEDGGCSIPPTYPALAFPSVHGQLTIPSMARSLVDAQDVFNEYPARCLFSFSFN
ncbi:hypothetical protein PVAP13_2NG250709 [Panicum virgatum]|uniref:Uncharacterized protein n=1 Tax=Panicum virgatum TaxID=38727 RepID=A0A8T0VBE3_PANVG|nr:hypothetical protein PVAP13_2NG250709 [Panicum virgatum]